MPPSTPRKSSDGSIILSILEEMRLSRTETAAQARELHTKIDGVHAYVVQEFKEIRETQTEILSRLAAGSERMESHGNRLNALESGGKTTALIPKPRPQDASSGRVPAKKNKTPPWYIVAAAGGALAFAGERAYRWAAFVASQEPPAVTSQQPKP